MIRKAYIKNQARKESYLRERREERELKRTVKLYIPNYLKYLN